jgi:predicted ArsR family transcriptional regulator
VTSTRRAILEFLKQEGHVDVRGLADRFGLTPMAIRLHLYELQEEGFIAHAEQRRPRGRPAKVWSLTPAADALFPDRHSDLTLSLLEATRTVLGEAGLRKVLAALSRRQADAYRKRIPAQAPLSRRLKSLAAMRTEEGYMMDLQPLGDGSHELIEKHCPICVAARACTGLCQAEIDSFRTALGRSVRLDRTEHILAGGRRCVYRVIPATGERHRGR